MDQSAELRPETARAPAEPVVSKQSSNPVERVSPRTRANRRNALKSTGPKSVGGKRRAALNRRRDLFPEMERELRARGEDPRDFRRMFCDLAAIFQPREPSDQAAVDLLARTWWAKARRIRSWVAPGPPRCDEQDELIEKLLLFIVNNKRERHQPWRGRLAEVLGPRFGSPVDVRRKIEGRLHVFGAKRRSRRYPLNRREERLVDLFHDEFAADLAGEPRGATQNSSNPAGGAPEERSQSKPMDLNQTASMRYSRSRRNEANAVKSNIFSGLRRLLARFSAPGGRRNAL
ncbi:MAG TPA: hypothetical protein VL523_17770 [Terriglobia bacterium]|nr:hypothetical protein [Terriglobia bacterium]